MGRIVVTGFGSLGGVTQAPGGGEGVRHEAWSDASMPSGNTIDA